MKLLLAVALVPLVALAACGSSARPKAAAQETEQARGADGTKPARVDQQRPLRLVYCVDPGGTSAGEAADAIRARLARRDDVVVKSEDDHLVFELANDRDGGPMDAEKAAAELAAVLRGGGLPRPVPCDAAGTGAD